MRTPFFIVGASRSGTTMLRLMLNAHSRLAVPDELKYFRHVEGQYDLDAWQTPLPEEAYRRLARGYVDTRSDVFPGDRDTLEDVVLKQEERTVRAPYRALLAHLARACGKDRWGEKTPHNIFYVDVIADMFPEAKFIHVVRDPRAAVQSMNSSSYYSNETVFNALNWRKSIRDGQSLFQAHLQSEQYVTVRYEDLVQEPEATLQSVCSFLDEPFESAMLRFYETADQDMAGQIQTPSIKGPINTDGLTKWRERLGPNQVTVVETLCRRELHRFKYKPAREQQYLVPHSMPRMAYWYWKVWQHRRKRGYEVEYPFLSGLQKRTRQWTTALRISLW